MKIETLDRVAGRTNANSGILAVLQEFQAKDSRKLFEPIPEAYEKYLTRCGLDNRK